MRLRDALRALLVAAGLALVLGGVQGLLTLPPPPPTGRDIPGGFAIIFLGLAVLVGVFLAIAGLALGGDDDPVFHGHQRTVLRVVGYVLGGSVLLGGVLLVTVDVLLGVAVPGLVAVLLLPVVLGVVCWRVGELVVRFGRRAAD
jgi:hypothetical protein